MDYSIIKNIAKQKGLSIKKLAEKSGITEQGFHSMVKNNSMTIGTLERLCDTLQISLVSLFDGVPRTVERDSFKDKYLSCMEEKELLYRQVLELKDKSPIVVEPPKRSPTEKLKK